MGPCYGALLGWLQKEPPLWRYTHRGVDDCAEFRRADRATVFRRTDYTADGARTLVEYLNQRSLTCVPDTAK
jgi:hypothetical protein